MNDIKIINLMGQVIEQVLYNVWIYSINTKSKDYYFIKKPKKLSKFLFVSISSVTDSRQKDLDKDIKKV